MALIRPHDPFSGHTADWQPPVRAITPDEAAQRAQAALASMGISPAFPPVEPAPVVQPEPVTPARKRAPRKRAPRKRATQVDVDAALARMDQT